VARYRPDGNIEFLGRVDRQIKVRGFRVELGEVEARLAQHPALREAAVLLREDRSGDQRLVAYVVPSDGVRPEPTTLRAFLETKLPDFMVPSQWVVLDALPLTPNGKIDRRALPAPSRARQHPAPYAPPQTELERLIATIWAEALNVEQVSAHDNFFDLGAHSLLMVQVHSKLQRALPKPVSLIDLFRHPTVSALARRLSEDDTPTASLLHHSVERAGRRKQALLRQAQIRTQAVDTRTV
jgi:aryl carrier-like protein